MQEMLERTDYISTTSRCPFGEQKVERGEAPPAELGLVYLGTSPAHQLQYISIECRGSDVKVKLSSMRSTWMWW